MRRLRLCVHGGHGQDLAPLLAPQLLADDTVDTTANRVTRLVDQHAGVVVEPDHAAVLTADGVLSANDHGLTHVTTLDLGGGRQAHHARVGCAALLLHDHDNAVADGRVPLLADDHGALDDGGARVVDARKHALIC